jgi:transposase
MKVKYTIKNFNEQFPDDNACLQYLFNQRHPNGGTCVCGKSGCFHRVTKRKKFACAWCGHQIAPTADTIFHKSSTSLRTWFHAIFIISACRNGVSAMELMRQVGVTYKTAWRMNHQIRQLMNVKQEPFRGTVETDETYLSGRKMALSGVVERDGPTSARIVPESNAVNLVGHVVDKVELGTLVMTDESNKYNSIKAWGYVHETVKHTDKEFSCGHVHVNSVEAFWSQFKRSVYGTFHHVSPQHCQKYLNEFAYRNSQRRGPQTIFENLIEMAHEQRSAAI